MKKIPTLQQITLLAFFWLLALPAAQSQDFIYTPVNSAFGGNTLNYGWMLNSANAQNTLSAPDDDSRREQNQLDEFTESLNRQLLSIISRNIFDGQFDNAGLEEGTYQFGNFQIDVVPGIDGLIITINDFSTGGSTQITVPFF